MSNTERCERALDAASTHYGHKVLEWFKRQPGCPTEQHGYSCVCQVCSGREPCRCGEPGHER